MYQRIVTRSPPRRRWANPETLSTAARPPRRVDQEPSFDTNQIRDWNDNHGRMAVEGLPALRRELESCSVEQIIGYAQSGVLSFLIQCLKSSHPDQQYQSAWAIYVVAHDAPTEILENMIANDVLTALLTCVESTWDYVREQAMWALGAIVGDSPQTRNQALNRGMLGKVLDLLLGAVNSSDIQFCRASAWLITNLCDSRDPRSPQDNVAPFIKNIVSLLSASSDEEFVTDILLAVGDLSTRFALRWGHMHLSRHLALLIKHQNSHIKLAAIDIAIALSATQEGDYIAVKKYKIIDTLQQACAEETDAVQERAFAALVSLSAGPPSLWEVENIENLIGLANQRLREGKASIMIHAADILYNIVSLMLETRTPESDSLFTKLISEHSLGSYVLALEPCFSRDSPRYQSGTPLLWAYLMLSIFDLIRALLLIGQTSETFNIVSDVIGRSQIYTALRLGAEHSEERIRDKAQSILTEFQLVHPDTIAASADETQEGVDNQREEEEEDMYVNDALQDDNGDETASESDFVDALTFEDDS